MSRHLKSFYETEAVVMKKKKPYKTPKLYCEDIHPEQMLCACEATDVTYSEMEMCGYPIKAPGSDSTFMIFGETWINICDISNTTGAGGNANSVICYGGPVVPAFSKS
jgi:hypothetical protein